MLILFPFLAIIVLTTVTINQSEWVRHSTGITNPVQPKLRTDSQELPGPALFIYSSRTIEVNIPLAFI